MVSGSGHHTIARGIDWSSRILALGTLQIMIGVVCGGLWLLVSERSFVKQLPDIRRKRDDKPGQ